MRQDRPFALTLGAALAVSVAASEVHAQFNPSGRKKPSTVAPGSSARPHTQASADHNAQSKPQTKPVATPAIEQRIQQVTDMVLAQPDATVPLRRLIELYRERDGTVDRLLEHMQSLAVPDTTEGFRATVALAGLERQLGQNAKARATYERASQRRPLDPLPKLALADMLRHAGELVPARQALEQALPNLTNNQQRTEVLRSLLLICLDLDDLAGAEQHHRALVRLSGNSPFVQAELGRELLLRGRHEQAILAFEKVVGAAQGDNRVMAPALRDLGQALLRAGKPQEALRQLRRALSLAGNSGIVTEIYQYIAEVYRSEGRLADLIKELESRGQGFEQLKLLGSLYEEMGELSEAARVYRRARGLKPTDVTLGQKLITLAEIEGDFMAAIAEYERLIAGAPGNSDFVFRLVDTLLKQGERARALEHLARLQQQAQGNDEVLAALVDYYERIGLPAQSLSLLERLALHASREPRHLVELGSRYWRADDKARAIKTWQKIEHIQADRARALLMLGEVLLEHQLHTEALAAYREARKLKPDDPATLRGLAVALQRAGAQSDEHQRHQYYEEATSIWFRLLESSTDRRIAAEARTQIVTLWSLGRSLRGRIKALELQLRTTPPNLHAGRLLAEVHLKLGALHEAERTLREVVRLAPGDIDSWAALERVSVRQGRLEEAISSLEQLVRLDPANARRFYQRMADHAQALYRDDDAITYARRAIEHNPEDADAHRRLGEMLRRQNRPEEAIVSLRTALAKNDRLFSTYFDLAELHIGQGQSDAADQLMRRVMKLANDDELITRAVRTSLQINLRQGTLLDLERELFRIALNRPNRAAYRELLVELYGMLALPLVHGANSNDAKLREASKNELSNLGSRAVKPLLDALLAPDSRQQQVAIELLSHLKHPGTGAALLTYAQGNGETKLRAQAVFAAGELEDESLFDRFSSLLQAAEESGSHADDPVSLAAVWAICRLRSERAATRMMAFLSSETPAIQALAALGLGRSGHHRAGTRLLDLARSNVLAPQARAAILRALGALGNPRAASVVAEHTSFADPLVRYNAMLSLASFPTAVDARLVADALLDPDPRVHRAALVAASARLHGRIVVPELLVRPHGSRLPLSDWLAAEPPAPEPTGSERVELLLWLAPELGPRAKRVARSSAEGAQVVFQSLGGSPQKPLFLPLLPTTEGLPATDAEACFEVTRKLTADLFPAFEGLARHPAAQMRVLAAAFMGKLEDARSSSILLEALQDRAEDVRLAAVRALTRRPIQSLASALARALTNDGSWAVRLHAAKALTTLDRPDEELVASVTEAAVGDTYALVRQAAVAALGRWQGPVVTQTLQAVARTDSDITVRRAAEALLEGR